MNVEEAICHMSKDIGLTVKPKQLEAVANFCNGKDVLYPFQLATGSPSFTEFCHLFLTKSEVSYSI